MQGIQFQRPNLCFLLLLHVIHSNALHCSQLQPAGQGAANEGPARQGSYLHRHTSSLILKMSQDAAVPPLPAVANLVCCYPLCHHSRSQSPVLLSTQKYGASGPDMSYFCPHVTAHVMVSHAYISAANIVAILTTSNLFCWLAAACQCFLVSGCC